MTQMLKMKKRLKFAGQYSLLVFAMFAMLFIAVENIPDNSPPAPTCSCAGKDDCDVVRFEVDRGWFADCALWVDGGSCCYVQTVDRETN